MNTQTYAEAKNKTTLDWRAILSQENITQEQWDDYANLASNWVTCACGNQCDIIPRRDTGQPVDDILAKLGGFTGFYGAIAEQDKKAALYLLNEIEKRSTFLINQINNS